MTIAEYMRKLSDEELAAFLCSKIDDCDTCPVTKRCRYKSNGMLNWLTSVWGEKKDEAIY